MLTTFNGGMKQRMVIGGNTNGLPGIKKISHAIVNCVTEMEERRSVMQTMCARGRKSQKRLSGLVHNQRW